MKIKFLPFLLLLCLLGACKEDDPVLEISETTINTDGQAATFKVDITSDSGWAIESNAAWCVASTTKGTNNYKLTLTIRGNTEFASRTAIVSIKAGKTSRTITVIQGPKINTETYSYKLPVIFHVLYANESDRLQYVDKGRLAAIIAKCNINYKAKTSPLSPDMNLEFVLATVDPNGVALEEAGVERIKIAETKVDCEIFMNGDYTNNALIMSKYWNPNEYINIFVYPFTNDNIMGISHLPYTPTAFPLEGLIANDHYFTALPTHPHCVSLNTSYVYTETGTFYEPRDVVVTLSHELGHYLGLHHAFSEGGNCDETDFCDDTPNYDQEAYYEWVDMYFDTTQSQTLQDLVTKESCEGTTFIARNIMDYAYCLADQFTEDQRTRIRHVLVNSPITPGPKETRAISRNAADLEVPPIIFKKLEHRSLEKVH